MCGFRKHKICCFFRCFFCQISARRWSAAVAWWLASWYSFGCFFASELAHATNKKWILLLSFALLSSPFYACINWKIEIFMEISLRQPVARSRLPMCTPNTRAKFFKFIFLSLDGAWKADDVHHMGFSCFSIYVKIIFIRPDPSGWMSPPIQDALLIYALISRLFS